MRHSKKLLRPAQSCVVAAILNRAIKLNFAFNLLIYVYITRYYSPRSPTRGFRQNVHGTFLPYNRIMQNSCSGVRKVF